ncbi:MAG: glutamate synthase [archaeon]
MSTSADRIISSRRAVVNEIRVSQSNVAEGGCGVLGISSSLPISGRYLLRPMIQMHNRGNGKGGGIAAVGLSAGQLGVSSRTLEETYLVQIAYLDPQSRTEVEEEFIDPQLDVEFSERVDTVENHQHIGLVLKPPDVWRYFVRVKESKLSKFSKEAGLDALDVRRVEDEFVYRNSFDLNRKYYASLGDKRAFVLSHGKNMMVLKIVGYAEQAITYYQLEDLQAHVWIGHQRYPTKGKVWHPGGSHPFIGLHDALVHNGDFANYHSISEYLKQRKMYPLFLTDTEVAALYWDLLTRVYEYPLEYAIEAIAPTTERDYAMLPKEKKEIYKAIQQTHIHGTPDGPWFFIIARNDPYKKQFQLIGITDTSMLRPQVFAFQDSNPKIGLIASEKQAIDAMLRGLAEDDDRFRPIAERYWYARGGSYTDGGAFIFTIDESKNLACTDKFGKDISPLMPQRQDERGAARHEERSLEETKKFPDRPKSIQLFDYVAGNMRMDLHDVHSFAEDLARYGSTGDEERSIAIEAFTLLIDRRYETGDKRRSEMVAKFDEQLYHVLDSIPSIEQGSNGRYCSVNWKSRGKLRSPSDPNQTLTIDMSDFAPEGDEGSCQFVDKACRLGWRRIIAYNFRGQRNFGAGLVARDRIRIDVYGGVGDCLAAFADGPEFCVHGSAQDSVAYCMKSGKLVIFGDAGKAFEYGAKGGVAYILGDLVDRPLINAVGSATAVINGSCKDYMGESFMAANGLIILNGIKFENGRIVEQETPYQGGNLFPLAAGGAVFLRDPRGVVSEDQLNGAEIVSISNEDWKRILQLLEENEKLFGIRVADLLTVDGIERRPEDVYRKVVPVQIAALMKYESHI